MSHKRHYVNCLTHRVFEVVTAHEARGVIGRLEHAQESDSEGAVATMLCIDDLLVCVAADVRTW
jgi:hypothetical protein